MPVHHLSKQRRAILDLLKRRGACSAQNLSDEIGLGKTTIRQHILRLEKESLIERAFKKVKRGRPNLVYKLSQLGHDLYPQNTGDVVPHLLGYLMETKQEEPIRQFFKSFWDAREGRFKELLAKQRGKDDFKNRIRALVLLLEKDGFMPQARRAGISRLLNGSSSCMIEVCNCPFRQISDVTSIPCEIETKFISWALGLPNKKSGAVKVTSDYCGHLDRKGE